MKRMKRLSFQWRITLLTAILIAGTCICSNLLLYRSGTVGLDSLNGFVTEYEQNSEENAGISQPQSHCLVQRSHIL